jgi:predicted nucleic acid-binding protein
VLDILDVVSLSADDYVTMIQRLADQGITGGATYDALVAHAALKTGAEQIVTLNATDFRRVAPSFADRVVTP